MNEVLEQIKVLAAEQAAADADNDDARIEELIEDLEELDSLVGKEAQELIEELRPLHVSEDVYEEIEEETTFGQRMADRVASVAGSWGFIFGFMLLMVIWMSANVLLGVAAFDPFPFILLNLTLSTLAALQAPVILMSQNRQAEKDRRMAQNDYQVNLKSEVEIADLHRKVDELTELLLVQSRMMNVLVSARRQELLERARLHEVDLSARRGLEETHRPMPECA
ncbi:MAG: DUF1003 domain-containing protein [Anaerolineae bacterium]|jgi:uncharacterized membrane protein|nr:DUF1003 domain-containing protein [Anaerolineae bacterium]